MNQVVLLNGADVELWEEENRVVGELQGDLVAALNGVILLSVDDRVQLDESGIRRDVQIDVEVTFNSTDHIPRQHRDLCSGLYPQVING